MKRKKMAFILGGIALVVLIGCLVIFKRSGDPDLSRYDFSPAQRMDLSERIDATGKVLALEKKDLYADYDGTVDKVHVKAGDEVKQGDILVTISSATLKQQWEEADSALKQANINLSLAAGQLATELALNKVTTNNALQLEANSHQVALYREQVSQAKQRLAALNAKNDGYYMADNEKLFIRAPFTGQIAWTNVRRGDKIDPQTILTTMINPQALGVEALVDENDIGLVKTGQPAAVTGKDPIQSQNSGLVTEIGVVGRIDDDETVDFPVRIQLDGTNRGLLPGMSVDVSVFANQRSKVLAIPAGSVTRKNGRDLVNLRRGKKLVEVPVELGLKQGKYYEVKSGLKAGDQVAVAKPPVLAKAGARPGGGPFGGGRMR